MDQSKIGKNRGNAGKGRPKGSPNKTTSMLREAILKAAENAGDGDLVDYLTTCAREDRRSFLTLLAKVLPSQIDGKVGFDFLSHEEALAELE